MNFSVTFTINDLDATQYYELLRLQDFLKDDSLAEITVHDDQTGTTYPVGIPEDFPLPNLEELLEEERMEQVALLQRITQRHIPVPLAVSKEQIEVIDEAIEADLERDNAFEVVDKLEEFGQSEQFTEIVVEKINSDGDVIESEYIDALPGTVNISLTDNESGEQYDPEKIRAPTRIMDATYEEIVESLKSDPDALDAILDQIPRSAVPELKNTPSNLFVLYEENEPGFWFVKDELRIQVIETSVAHPPIRCGLCGQATSDVKYHLLSECPVLQD
jgi:hypothetical protein